MRPGLYVVATPLGNLGDLSPRAAAVLTAASLVAAEDTRTSQRLFAGAGAGPRLVSLTEHNVEARSGPLLEAATEGVVALVSDAGTPLVSDPGARLVAAAHARAVPVFAVPGPSALTAALSVAGFDGGHVLFLGFLPRSRGERLGALREACAAAPIVVFFESPNRLGQTLGELATTLRDPEVVVCRELTKVHEEAVRGLASALAGRFGQTRGECTVVVQSPPRPDAEEAAMAAYMGEMRRAGARRGAAAGEAARRFGVSRDRAYALWEGADAPE
ncbi:MAG: 16S rRNA (cytidine(1402)-2'-O)-methyltransferase [Dehalococcoidia bacterium]|nr:16S rRNA (cytidine(1402)-2'-O)-methyltransferase [Dehalococcoidia bacterium]